jgi:hypothetical protein
MAEIDPSFITEACHGVQLVRSLLANNFEWLGPGTILDESQMACRLLDAADAALGRLYQYVASVGEPGLIWDGDYWHDGPTDQLSPE